LIAPDTPHQVMVSQPALFNQAAAVFYRSTEQIARERAELGGRTVSARNRRQAEGATLWDPAAVAQRNLEQSSSESDPFSKW
jgi:hypothetical protein